MKNESNHSANVKSKLQAILDAGNHPIAKYVSRLLFQYKLDPSLVFDILNEAFIRSHTYKKHIVNPEAWLKVVCFNIVRETKRDQQRHVPIDDDRSPLPQLIHLDHPDLDDVFIKNHPIIFYKDALAEAWAKLDADQKLILGMRILEDKSWKQVAESLTLVSIKLVSESTARQRGNRALAALKEKMV